MPFQAAVAKLQKLFSNFAPVFNDPVITSGTVFARNCEARKIDRKTADEFLDLNHIYGSAKSRHCYGLFRRRVTGASEKACSPIPCGTETPEVGAPEIGELVAVASFSNARRWKRSEGTVISSYEWLRYASQRDTRVVGGMGKLLKAFIEDIHPDDIMTYAISTAAGGRAVRDGIEAEGNAFRKLGFIEEERKSFPSRLSGDSGGGQMSVSIKFRLRPGR